MYFEDITLGMTIEIAPAVIANEGRRMNASVHPAPDVRFRRRRVGDFASQKQQTQDVTEAIVKRRPQ